MAIRYWWSETDRLIPIDELTGEIRKGKAAARSQASKTRDRTVRGSSTRGPAQLPEGATPFTPIGIGKPLNVKLRAIYVGRMRGMRSKDVLVTAAVKAAQTLDAQPRSILLLRGDVQDHSYLEFDAFSEGGPIIFYTRSLTDFESLISLEIVPDSFDSETIDRVRNLLQRSAGLPVFAPGAAALLAGNSILKIYRDLGRVFLERGASLSDTLSLKFDSAGFPDFASGVYLVHNDGDSGEFASGSVSFEDNSWRFMKNNLPYRGDRPYLILTIDGRSEPALEGFTPRLASAAVLEKFYPSEDGWNEVTEDLTSALQLYNDLKFRKRAEDVKAALQGAPKNGPEYERLAELYEALRQNIAQKELQLTPLPKPK